jgi:hypothetical protein
MKKSYSKKTMKQNKRVILALFTVICFCIPTKAQNLSKFSVKGYNWGLTRDQVKAITPYKLSTALSTYDMLCFDVDIWNRIRFTFKDGQLNKIWYSHTFYNEKKQVIAKYNDYKDQLMATYHNPVSEIPGFKKELPTICWLSDSTEICLSQSGKYGVWLTYNNLLMPVIITAATKAKEQAIADSGSLFADRFNDNKNNWETLITDSCITKIENGSYSFENLKENWMYSWKTIDLDPTKNFTIECKTKWMSGVDNSGYGMLWSYGDWYNYRSLLVTANGYYSLWDSKLKPNFKLGWTSSYYVHKKGENILKIKRKAEVLEIYLNGTLISRALYKGEYGIKFGLAMYGMQTVQFDDIVVTEEKEEIVSTPIQFGNLTFFTKDIMLSDIKIHIEPVMTQEESDQYYYDLSSFETPTKYGANTGHWGELVGMYEQTDYCILPNDPYDGTNGNNNKKRSPNASEGIKGLGVGPFAGDNWNNSQYTLEGADPYYSVNLPYGTYKISYSNGQYQNYGFLQVIDSDCKVLELKRTE